MPETNVLEQTTWLVALDASSSSDPGPYKHPLANIAAAIVLNALFKAALSPCAQRPGKRLVDLAEIVGSAP